MNVVNPGVVETPLQKRGGMSQDAYVTFLERSINHTHPLGTYFKYQHFLSTIKKLLCAIWQHGRVNEPLFSLLCFIRILSLGEALNRVAQPEEVGELIAFLASNNAKFITGECIAIDGGRQNLGAR